VFFGESGRTIDRLKRSEGPIEPVVFRQFVKEGTALPPLAREHFLAQGLWRVPLEGFRDSVQQLNTWTKNYLEVSYVESAV
jgi:hypothetical protein